MTIGWYKSDLSDLMVKVVKIHYQNEECLKAKIRLYNKNNGIFYEQINVKLIKSNISHWEKVHKW